MHHLAVRLGVTERAAATAMIDAQQNMNEAVRLLETRGEIRGGRAPEGAYGLVAVESYTPVTFCLLSFSVARYEALSDPTLLETMHELVLSASEMPIDSSSEELTKRFASEWTTENGELCGAVMRRAGLQIHGVALLPHGDYSVHGLYVHHPVSPADFPNIGVGATAVALDLKTGIHDRFRFAVEKIADSVAEHVAREHCAFGQVDHILKQPFWWMPSHSVEDYLRYKESLLMPSALIHEMRYAFAHHHLDGGVVKSTEPLRVLRPNPYRNLVELEELKSMQYKLGKHFKENGTPGNVFTRSGVPAVLASVGGENSGFGGNESTERFTDLARAERKIGAESGMLTASERVWRRFYQDSLF